MLNEDRISFVPHLHPLPNLNKPPGNTKKTCPAKRKEKMITTLSNKQPCLIMDQVSLSYILPGQFYPLKSVQIETRNTQ